MLIWILTLVAAFIAGGVIFVTLDKRGLRNRVAALNREKSRLTQNLEQTGLELRRAREDLESVMSALGLVKAQYDIPESTLEQIMQASRSETQLPDFKNLKTVKAVDLGTSISVTLNRHETTRILYPRFTVTAAVSAVKPGGQSTVSLGYLLPDAEVPESLLIELRPSQFKVITSGNQRELFYVGLLAADPVQRSVLIEIKPLSAVRDLAIVKPSDETGEEQKEDETGTWDEENQG